MYIYTHTHLNIDFSSKLHSGQNDFYIFHYIHRGAHKIDMFFFSSLVSRFFIKVGFGIIDMTERHIVLEIRLLTLY